MRNKKFKIRVSLTIRRANLLAEAKKITEDMENIDYVFNDVNGNIKLKLKKGKKKYYVFNSLTDLAEVLGILESHQIEPQSEPVLNDDTNEEIAATQRLDNTL